MRIPKNLSISFILASILLLALTIIHFNKPSKSTLIFEKVKQDRPDLAAEQEFEMTKDLSLGYPPVSRKIQAFKQAQKKLNAPSNAKAIDNVVWDERGPDNVGGRTRALIFDPNDPSGNRVFAGTVAGGLWYNNNITDANSKWQNINDFMTNLSISTLAYDPQNTQTFYAGTGLGFTGRLRGAGLWKSTDGGDSWDQIPSTDNDEFLYTQKIVITSTSTVIAATLDGLKVSTDGGTTWTTAISEDMTDVDVIDDGVNGELIYASDYSGNIFKSSDDGATWDDISPNAGGDRVELAIAPTNGLVVYAVGASGSNVAWFKKTIDGGANWTDITIPNYTQQSGGSCTESTQDFTRGQAFFDLILGVYPNDENSLIVGGIDLHRSTDGGDTWELISYWTGGCDAYVHADQHAILFKEGSDSEAIFGNDGGVFYSDNLDEADPLFLEAINGYNTALFYATASANLPAGSIYLAGAQDNGSQLFRKIGINSTTEATGGDGAYCFIDQDDPNIMITSYVYNSYYISIDGGNSFNSFVNNQNAGNFINQADYDDEANILYATSNPNEIAVYSELTSTSPTTSVKTVSIGSRQASHIRATPYTENRIILGTEGGKVYIIDNANDSPSVTNIDNGQLPSGTVSCIDIGASDDHLLVTYSNYGQVSVWETTDGGSNWVNKEGDLPDMPVRWALYNPMNLSEVLLATEVGIWSTDDITLSSPEWAPTTNGLANVRCDMLQYRESDQQVVVATFGRGLFTTNVFAQGLYPAFDADKRVTFVGKTVSFKNGSVGQVTDYSWSFGDGVTSSDENPTHVYAAPGSFSISLGLNQNAEIINEDDFINIIPNRGTNYTLSEGGNFEDFQGDFIADNVTGTGFELGSSTITDKDGTASGDFAWVIGLEDDNYVNNSTAYLYTPHFDFSAAGSYEISFKTKYKFEDNWDGFIVDYTLDSGKTWVKLNAAIETGWYNQISDPASVFGASVPIFSGNTSGAFEEKSTDVSFLAESERVGFRIVFKSDAGVTDVGMAVDDFQLTGPSSDAVADFSVTPSSLQSCVNNVVTFHDQSSGSITSYSWDFGVGAQPATATGRGPHEVMYSANGSPDITLTVVGETNGTVAITKPALIEIQANNIAEKPVTVSNAEVCYGESTNVSIENSDVGYSYQLFDAETNQPIGSKLAGNGNTLSIETDAILLETTFYVIVEDLNSTCDKVLSDQPTVTVLAPNTRTVTFTDTEICAGESVVATVENSEDGVSYSLVDVDKNEIISELFTGNGEDLQLESSAVSDTINLVINASSPTCELNLGNVTEVVVKPLPEAVIISNGSQLEAPAGAEAYQWYLEGEMVAGQTSNITQANSYGEYTVDVTLNGCTATSEPFSPVVLDVEELIAAGELKFYPNPTIGAVNINQKGMFNYLKVYDQNGRIVESRNILNNEVISLHQFRSGLFIFKLTGPQSDATFRINKIE